MRSLGLLLIVLVAGPVAAQSLQPAFPNLSFDIPVNDIQAPDDGSNRLFVAEQDGQIKVFENTPDVTASSVFLDIADRLNPDKGIIGFVFDPAYAQNGLLYVQYNRDHPDNTDPDFYQHIIARFQVTSDPSVADPSSEEILLIFDMRRAHHTGGQLQFGPDGYLYASVGEDVGPGDPNGHGQNTATLPSSLLRLDVHGGGLPLDCGAGTATVPADNPFADGSGGACDEIWAYGFRNPWRFSFDPDDRLWLADVGEDAWEEVDLVEAGGNYGWNTLEGTHCFNPAIGCDPTGTTFPIYEYPHDTASPTGGLSVIGGYVYTGNNCAPLLGGYLYGDFVTTNVWALRYDGETAENEVIEPFSGLAMTTFGRDEQGEIYLADFGSGTLSTVTCDQPVTVRAVPAGSTVIPASGGVLAFDVTLANTTASAQPFQAWATADLANGTERTVIAPVSATLPAGASVMRRVTLAVPAGAPSGVSTLVVKTGSFPDAPVSGDLFTVRILSVSGATGGGSVGAVWRAEGFTFTEDETVMSQYASPLAAYPTPFVERTTIRFVLSEATAVRLVVYDVLGREVAVLADGLLEAGRHDMVLDGSGLSGGVYLVQLEAAGQAQMQRVVLLK